MDFAQFRERVYITFKLNLNAYKESQLKRRLDALMAKKQYRPGDYEGFLKVLMKDKQEYTDFIDTVTINVSEFFRDKEIFDTLETKVFPMMVSKGALKIWSAACSIGCEAYSMAMILNELTNNRMHSIEATDIDKNILSSAAAGVYKKDHVRNVKKDRLVKYFKQNGDSYVLADSIKRMVKFRQHDLLTGAYGQNYDLIVCRNVMIYFTKEIQDMLNKKFIKALKPGGVFFIGASEMIFNHKELGLEKIASCYYLRK